MKQVNSSQYPQDVLQQVDWIGRRLYRERRVSVLIGAGFSRNADSNRADLQPLATWWELAQKLGKSLGLTQSELERKSATRIPGEFEAAFGREVLNNTIQDILSDTDFKPSELHVNLLRLPWTDVFTTNYDTLLEQATKQVFERRYSIVTTIEDLTSTRQPRIVKLHGSFPSNRPFIVTEEDFRTYPKRFAPFVNLVQQSLIENTLILIGFSGDDPNFLAWSGWVRDALGIHAPRVVLVTIDIDHAARRYLENRNVNVIDLGSVVGKTELETQDRRHAEAYTWFIKRLENSKPLSPFGWPGIYDSFNAESTPMDEQNEQPKILELFSFNPLAENGQILKTQLEQWQKMRQEYPGWVVCPVKPRTKLLTGLQYSFLPSFRDNCDKIPERSDLLVAREVMWWCETALAPLDLNDMKKIQSIWNKYMPFSRDNSESLNPKTKPEWDWSVIAVEWLEIGLGLLRMARMWTETELFKTIAEQLEPHISFRPVFKKRFDHERLVFALVTLNVSTVNTMLNQWIPDWNDPFWETRRASVLGELGRVEEARELALKALGEIRNRTSQHGVDYRRLSEEGWTLHLIKLLNMESTALPPPPCEENPDLKKFQAATQERLQQLALDWCDPEDIIDLAFGDVPHKPFQNPVTHTNGRDSFDPDIWTSSHTATSNWEHVVKSITPFEMLVQGGSVYKLGHLNVNAEQVLTAIEKMWDFMPTDSVFHATRLRNANFVKDHLTRHAILALNENHAKFLITEFLQAVSQALHIVKSEADSLAYLPGKRITDAILQVGIDALSRLTLRMNPTELMSFFEIITDAYRLPRVQVRHFLHHPLKAGFKRWMNVVPIEDFNTKLTALLDLPIPSEANFNDAGNLNNFPEPFNPNLMKQKLTLKPGSIPSATIQRLLGLLKNDQREVRSRALFRLLKLNESGCFNNSQRTEFADAIWTQRDADGLPSFDSIYKFSYLNLPAPSDVNVDSLLRKYLLSKAVPYIQKPNVPSDAKIGVSVSVGPDENQHFFNDLYVTLLVKQAHSLQWSEEELETLFNAVKLWWKEDGLLVLENKHLKDIAHDRVLKEMTQVFDALLPRLTSHSQTMKKRVCTWIDYVERTNINLIRLEPIKLLFKVSEKLSVTETLKSAFENPNRETNTSAAYGVLRWLDIASKHKIHKCPNLLIEAAVLALGYSTHDDPKTVWDAFNNYPSFLNQLNPNQFNVVFQILERVRVSTKISPDTNISTPSPTGISWADKPALRARASKLAALTWQHFQSKNETMPAVLTTWRTDALNDCLPEVRNPWIPMSDANED